MASGDTTRTIRAPGRLVVGPTDLSAAYPYGGTEVGKTQAVIIHALGLGFRVESEGLGEATDILEPSNQYVFACVLRGWDDDAVAQFFSGKSATGTVSGHQVYQVPGSIIPGASALSRALILLYVPDDPIHVPSVLVYRGIPDWSENAELAFQRGEELVLPVVAECLRDSNDNILQIGIFSDLSLT